MSLCARFDNGVKFECRCSIFTDSLVSREDEGQVGWAGLGVMFTKSEKSKAWEGVLGPPILENTSYELRGVDIIDEGRARFRGGGGGGVDGETRVLFCLTGKGDEARKNDKSVPFPFASLERFLVRAPFFERCWREGGV